MKQSLKMENKKVVLIEKSTELFLTYGIQHVSMDDIADKCGILKKTIYKFEICITTLIRAIQL